MGSSIEWDGRKFWREAKTGYYLDNDRNRLHRLVYEKHFGSIPKGFDVHHKDENTANNAPGNLVALPHGAHLRLHRAGKRVGTSDQNAAWSRRSWNVRKRVKVECLGCRNTFRSRARGEPRKFCSSACLERYRSSAFQPCRRSCVQCGHEYIAQRTAQKFCTRQCNNTAAQQRERAIAQVHCAECWTRFASARANARFCGRPCAVAFHSKAGGRRRRKVSEAR